MRLYYIFFIGMLFFPVSKNNTANAENKAKQTTQKILSGKTQNDDASACDILTKDIAKSLFRFATTWRSESNEGSYPMCYRYFDDIIHIIVSKNDEGDKEKTIQLNIYNK